VIGKLDGVIGGGGGGGKEDNVIFCNVGDICIRRVDNLEASNRGLLTDVGVEGIGW